MLKNIFSILQSAWFLALLIGLCIIPFMPHWFDKYVAEVTQSDAFVYRKDSPRYDFYADLNGDGLSEKIMWYTNAAGPNINIFDHNGATIEQVNFPYPPAWKESILFGDRDGDGWQEMYYWYRQDSAIYLQQLIFMENPVMPRLFKYKMPQPVYVDHLWKNKHWKRGNTQITKYDGGVWCAFLSDLNEDGSKEVVFLIKTGFSCQPRNFYAYDIVGDTLLKSPTSGAALEYPQSAHFDLDRDGSEELVYGSFAANNLPAGFPYSDTASYLMALDNDLHFLFEPVRFPYVTSETFAMPFTVNDSMCIAVLYLNRGIEQSNSALMLFSTAGKMLLKKEFSARAGFKYRILSLSTVRRDRFYLLNQDGDVVQLDEHFDTLGQRELGKLSFDLENHAYDLDMDGREELILCDRERQKIIITRDNFSHPTYVNILNRTKVKPVFSLKLNGEKKPELFVFLEGNWHLISYRFNYLYYMKYLIYAAVFLVLSLFFYVIKRIWFRKLEQDKKLLEKTVEERTRELREQKREIEQSHREIRDSINYARRIQDALLKPEEHITRHLPQHFIFFQPKDVVSGDFYWSLEKEGHLYFAAADCTGHGVPGAFMSMLGIAFLNEINAVPDLLSPGDILSQLRHKIIKELGQTGATGESKDGMDISLCMVSLHPGGKDERVQLEWAGANNPLWIIRAKASHWPDYIIPFRDGNQGGEIKADKQPIGYYDVMRPFKNHCIQLERGDMLYVFSDGFADQFGGPRGKKYKYRTLKKTLLEIHRKPVEEQKQILSDRFNEWKGELEQVDDICVIGMRV